MRVTVNESMPKRFAKRVAKRLRETFRSHRTSASTILILAALWLTSVLAIAEYWRNEVPAVQAVGARATAHRVLDLR
jgi:hypothetical protein